jgi:hypothetical protein
MSRLSVLRLSRLPLCLALAASLPALAQEDARGEGPLKTDRPDFVESSEVVGKGRVQLETSFLVERERDAQERQRTWSMPTMLRVGLGDALELRIESEGRTVQHSTDKASGERSTTAGYADSSVGLLWHVLDADGKQPSVGVIVDATLPTGSNSLRGKGLRPSLRVVGEWELPADLELGIMPGIAFDHDQEHERETPRHSYGLFGIVLDKAFNERLHGLAEISLPRIARSRHGGTQASVDLGLTYLLSKDCQLDTLFSRGLNHRTPYASWTVGLSIRL